MTIDDAVSEAHRVFCNILRLKDCSDAVVRAIRTYEQQGNYLRAVIIAAKADRVAEERALFEYYAGLLAQQKHYLRAAEIAELGMLDEFACILYAKAGKFKRASQLARKLGRDDAAQTFLAISSVYSK